MKTEILFLFAAALLLLSGCANTENGTEVKITTSSTTYAPAETSTSIAPTTEPTAAETSTSTTASTTHTTTTASEPTTTSTVPEEYVESASVSTDKSEYHTGEKMKVSVDVNSLKSVYEVTMKIYGLKSKYGYKIDETREVNLKVGENTFEYDYQTPACYGCAGLTPGEHTIAIELEYNGRQIASAATNVTISP